MAHKLDPLLTTSVPGSESDLELVEECFHESDQKLFYVKEAGQAYFDEFAGDLDLLADSTTGLILVSVFYRISGNTLSTGLIRIQWKFIYIIHRCRNLLIMRKVYIQWTVPLKLLLAIRTMCLVHPRAEFLVQVHHHFSLP